MPNGKVKKKIWTFLLYSYFFIYSRYTWPLFYLGHNQWWRCCWYDQISRSRSSCRGLNSSRKEIWKLEQCLDICIIQDKCSYTKCPKSSYTFYIVTYYLKWVTTSWQTVLFWTPYFHRAPSKLLLTFAFLIPVCPWNNDCFTPKKRFWITYQLFLFLFTYFHLVNIRWRWFSYPEWNKESDHIIDVRSLNFLSICLWIQLISAL